MVCPKLKRGLEAHKGGPWVQKGGPYSWENQILSWYHMHSVTLCHESYWIYMCIVFWNGCEIMVMLVLYWMYDMLCVFIPLHSLYCLYQSFFLTPFCLILSTMDILQLLMSKVVVLCGRWLLELFFILFIALLQFSSFSGLIL